MNKIRKAVALSVLALVAAVSLLTIKPVQVWARNEGHYIYSLFAIEGPIYVFKSRVGGAQGIVVSTSAYTGASQAGVPTAGAGIPLTIVGGQLTSQRASCAAGTEGQIIYDPTVHSIAFCDATNWHKLVTGSGTNDSWTSY